MNKRQTLLLPLLILVQLGTTGIRAQWIPAQGMDGAYTTDIEIQDSILFIFAPCQGISRRNIQYGSWLKTFPSPMATIVETDQYVIGANYYSLLYRSDDQGMTWDTINISPYSGDKLISCNNSVLFCTEYNVIIRSDDYGITWYSVSANLPPFQGIQICGRDSTLFAFDTYNYFMYVSHDLGITWDSLPCAGLPVDMDNNGLYYYQSAYWLAQFPGGVYKFSESAGYWVSTSDTLCFDGFGEYSGVLYGYGPDGFYQLNSNWDGWNERMDGIENLRVIAMCSEDTMLFCATERGPFRTSTSMVWEPYYDGLHGAVISCVDRRNEEVWICSDFGLFTSYDSGTSFIECHLFPADPPMKIILTDSSYYLATRYNFYTSNDFGQSWIQQNNGLPNDFYMNDFSLGSEYMFLIYKGKLYRSTYENIQWELTSYPYNIHTQHVASNDSIVLVAINYTSQVQFPIKISVNHATSFDTVDIIQWESFIHLKYIHDKFFMYGDCPYYFSDDNGYSWDSINCDFIDFLTHDLSENDECLIVTGKENYQPPHIYLSYNHGENWTDIKDNLGNYEFEDFYTITLSPTRILLGTSSNGLWYRDDLLTGVPASEIKKENTLLIFPNPAQDQISVLLNLAEEQSGTIDIYTILGGKIYSNDQVLFSAGKQPFTLETSSFPNGLYLIVIHLDGKDYQGKLVKQ